MADDFEERYLDVLQNVESSLISVYYKYPKMTDHGALYIIETLIKVYTSESQGRAAAVPQFQSHEQEAYQSVKSACEWRLGRAPLKDEKGEGVDLKPITIEEAILCLKRIKKSIEFWQKRGGRRAYFDYVSQFLNS